MGYSDLIAVIFILIVIEGKESGNDCDWLRLLSCCCRGFVVDWELGKKTIWKGIGNKYGLVPVVSWRDKNQNKFSSLDLS